MSHWFQKLIHSGLMTYKSLNHWFTCFIQNRRFLQLISNKTLCCFRGAQLWPYLELFSLAVVSKIYIELLYEINKTFAVVQIFVKNNTLAHEIAQNIKQKRTLFCLCILNFIVILTAFYQLHQAVKVWPLEGEIMNNVSLRIVKTAFTVLW